jgi:hypothetical protein
MHRLASYDALLEPFGTAEKRTFTDAAGRYAVSLFTRT